MMEMSAADGPALRAFGLSLIVGTSSPVVIKIASAAPTKPPGGPNIAAPATIPTTTLMIGMNIIPARMTIEIAFNMGRGLTYDEAFHCRHEFSPRGRLVDVQRACTRAFDPRVAAINQEGNATLRKPRAEQRAITVAE